NLLQVRLGFLRTGQIGFADNLQKGGAGPVEVHQAVLTAAFFVVEHLAGILFQVDTDDADSLTACSRLDLEVSVVAEGQIILADLVVLGQVGVVVVLAVPLGKGSDIAVEGQGCPEGQVEGPPVHDWQNAGQADAHRAGGRVGRQTESGATAAKQ